MRSLLRCDMLIIAAVLFVILTGIAMLVYPGGNYENNNSEGFSFTRNFFSDLGATRTFGDRANILSMVLFILATLLTGLCFSLFTFNYRVISNKKDRLSFMGKTSVLFGITSGLAFVGVASSPVNLFPTAHEYLALAAFGSLLVYVVLICVIQAGNKWNRLYLIMNIIYIILLGAYFLILAYGPGLDSTDGLIIQAVSQKIVVYSSILNLMLQACGIRRYLTSPEYDNNLAGV